MPVAGSALEKLSSYVTDGLDKVIKEFDQSVNNARAQAVVELSDKKNNEKDKESGKKKAITNINKLEQVVGILGKSEGHIKEGKQEESVSGVSSGDNGWGYKKKPSKKEEYKEPVEGLPWLEEGKSSKQIKEQDKNLDDLVINTENIKPETMDLILGMLKSKNMNSEAQNITQDQSVREESFISKVLGTKIADITVDKVIKGIVETKKYVKENPEVVEHLINIASVVPQARSLKVFQAIKIGKQLESISSKGEKTINAKSSDYKVISEINNVKPEP